MAGKFTVIGESVPVREAPELVTGKAQFVDDMPAQLHVKILRSPHAHARIISIEPGEAKRLNGVKAVLTHKEVPDRLMPRGAARALYILDPHLRHVGDEVAAVAATSKAMAERALELIRVEYEVLPAVFDPEEALKEDAPRLYPEGNVFNKIPFVAAWGDVGKGFAEADVVVEDRFEIKPQMHAALEPHVCIGSWKGDQLTLWSATQTPTEVQEGIAQALDMPASKIRVISRYIGGGFGGKYLERYQALTALLSKMAGGEKTKCVLTREESLTHAKRFLAKEYVKIGAKKDGTITAIQFKGYADLGGYGNYYGFANFYGEFPCCAYKCKNVRFDGWDVHTNHFTSQPCRSVHMPATTFATEQVIDQVAEKVGMDPAEFRLKNMVETGDITPSEPWVENTRRLRRGRLESYPSRKIMRQVMSKMNWGRWQGWGKPIAIDGPKRRGLGIVYSGYESGFWGGSFMNMAVSMYRDGSLKILSCTQGMGQSPSTTLCQLGAESLGIPLDDVDISSGDTELGTYDRFGAIGSHQLTTAGNILLKAIEELKQKIRLIAAQRLKVKPEEVEVYGKRAYVRDNKTEAVPISRILRAPITVTSAALPENDALVAPEDELGVKPRNAMVLAAEVEVDIETGEVRVIKVVTGNCPGRAINPGIVRGQYIGGTVMGLGYALQEEFSFDEKNSVYLHSGFVDYRVPRAKDVPPVESVIVEETADRAPHEITPYGAIGVGELGVWGGPAVIATAIYNATGIRMRKCPMTAERILEALNEGRR
ncbi:MAG: xanthine dehydrogenase family protein molybdopterin-binding subunit [Candidatus Tectomicrobia bacterium]|uniref:Xanthine dehydrogenase family protein molybdopterin-binding subunit n=1 Tax=Tectimicrobiota bacterium TaxID=2528274 RepID=A0A933GMG4_UNCTE|nr:xanthine dehydrogenase family protein molybdopterin-binding subunit [Candidatus Tectomicrobia bacterium]